MKQSILRKQKFHEHLFAQWLFKVLYAKYSREWMKSTKTGARERCKKRCSLKFRKFHRKTPVPESFFDKVTALRPATSLKK